MSLRDDIRNIVFESAENSGSKPSLVKAPKEKQIRKAISTYAKDCRPEDVVAMLDTTLFSSGKAGFIFTETGVYASDMNFCVDKDKTTPQPLLYEDVRKLQLSGRSDLSIKHADGRVTEAYLGSDKDFFIAAFSKIHELLNIPVEAEEEEPHEYDFQQELSDGTVADAKILNSQDHDGQNYDLCIVDYDDDFFPYYYREVEEGHELVKDEKLISALYRELESVLPAPETLAYDFALKKGYKKPMPLTYMTGEENACGYFYFVLPAEDGRELAFLWLGTYTYLAAQDRDHALLLPVDELSRPEKNSAPTDVVVLEIEKNGDADAGLTFHSVDSPVIMNNLTVYAKTYMKEKGISNLNVRTLATGEFRSDAAQEKYVTMSIG